MQSFLNIGCQVAQDVYDSSSLWLRPYQVEAVSWGRLGNCLLHLSPGLGKTPCAASIIRGLQTVVLVVPRMAKNVWVKDLPRFAGISSIIELRGNRNLIAERKTIGPMGIESEEILSGDLPEGIFMVTHECVGSWFSFADTGGIKMVSKKANKPAVNLPKRLDCVVIDESHKFGQKGSKRSIGMTKLARITDKVILLSGTPDLGGTHRLWFQLNLLQKYGFGSYHDFLVRYCGAIETDYGWKPIVATNQSELAAKMSGFVLSYRQEDVASYLPKNTRDRIVVPLSAREAQRLGSVLKAAKKALAKLGEAKVDRPEKFLPGEVIEARRACASAKVKALVEEAEQVSKGGEKLVVWAWHREFCNDISTRLAKKDVPAWVVHGGVDELSGNRVIDAWAKSEAGVLIATMARLGEGEDRLVAAAWQFFLEIDWLPHTVLQAERRLVRFSQTRPVNTRFFQLEIDFERSLMDRVLTRAQESDTLLGGSASLDIGELFGVKNTGSMSEVLHRLGRRLG